MKLLNIICGALAMSALSLQVQAETKSAPSAETKAEITQETPKKEIRPGAYPAQKSVAKLRTFKGKINKKAEFYIYLTSASWCPPCVKEMPNIAKEYKEMKKDGRVELILIGADRSKKAAKNFLKKNKAAFPGVMQNHKSVSQLLGYTKPSGVPNAIIVDKNGKVIINGHGALVNNWKEHTIETLTDKSEDGSDK